MTEALKVMVEAVQADLIRQELRLQRDGVELDSCYDGARFDVETAVRAGLLAVRNAEGEALTEIILAGADVPDSVQRFWPKMIDRILGVRS